ncbi:flagellar brake protein [Virgibacillus necropolis]|uniref:Pilus assembly protein PilZ n=1 Tax=Virgibacillus necropolis TaxID=163877 RepID=A0A221MCT0_9BACI|nr:flagellar brake domain-containing protein [Virgibacillus necropolis]ASN05498.1 pilus assembly protein PilZ [Virgibacillus necropolis]
MDIGTLLTLTAIDPMTGINTTYRCKIIEKNEHYLIIDYPVNEKTKRTAMLPKGTNLQTSYIGSDQSVYSFSTKVVAKVNVPIPALAISNPDKTEIKRIQRRAFVRIETAVDVSIHRTEHKSDSFTTVTSNISGGGMSIIMPATSMVQENECLDVWIVLQMQNDEFHYIHTQSKVIKEFTDRNNVRLASIMFENLSKQDQQVLIRYCFEKQREFRTKEMT